MRDQQGRHLCAVHPYAEPITCDTRLSDFEDRAPDTKSVTDTNLIVRQPVYREVFAELTLDVPGLPEMGLPVSVKTQVDKPTRRGARRHGPSSHLAHRHRDSAGAPSPCARPGASRQPCARSYPATRPRSEVRHSPRRAYSPPHPGGVSNSGSERCNAQTPASARQVRNGRHRDPIPAVGDEFESFPAEGRWRRARVGARGAVAITRHWTPEHRATCQKAGSAGLERRPSRMRGSVR